MNSFFLKVALVLGAFLSLQAMGNEIYKTVDENGNIQYSDSPPAKDAPPIALPDINIQPAATPKVRVSPIEPEGPIPIQVWISSPVNDDVINRGALSFTITGDANRGLEENETTRLLVNGEVYGGQSRALQWSVSQLIRGEYQVQIQVLADGAIVASSAPVKVHVQRAFAR